MRSNRLERRMVSVRLGTHGVAVLQKIARFKGFASGTFRLPGVLMDWSNLRHAAFAVPYGNIYDKECHLLIYRIFEQGAKAA